PEPPSDPQEDVRLHRSLGDRGGPPPQPAEPEDGETAGEESSAADEEATEEGAAEEPATEEPATEEPATEEPSPPPATDEPAGQGGAQDTEEDGDSAGDYGSVEELRQAVKEKISDEAMAAAFALLDPESSDQPVEELQDAVREFSELTGPEVSVL